MTPRRITLALWLLAMGALPWLIRPRVARPAVPPLADLPRRLGPWRSTPAPFRPRQTGFAALFAEPGYDRLSRIYRRADGVAFEVQLFYAPARAPDNRLTYFPVTCLHGGYEEVTGADVTFGENRPARQIRVRGKNGEHAMLLYWLQSPGRSSRSPASHLYWLYLQDVLGRRTDGVLVKIADTAPPSSARDRALADLARHLAAAVDAWFAAKP